MGEYSYSAVWALGWAATGQFLGLACLLMGMLAARRLATGASVNLRNRDPSSEASPTAKLGECRRTQHFAFK